MLNQSGTAPGTHITPDFKAIFESAPGLYLVLRPDFTIVAVSDAYLRATMTCREDIIGRDIFEVFPDNPDDPTATGVSNLKASLTRVRDAGVTDAMAVQKYDIRRPESEGGGFEERYWSPVNSPVRREGTLELLYIIHRVEDVTDYMRLKQQGMEQSRLTQELRTRTEKMEGEIFQRAQQLQDANLQLRAANEQLDRLDQLKNQLFANVSHELRTPLALIIGFTDKLASATQRTPEESRDLATVARNARALLGHVNDLLDVSKLAAGEMRPDYVEVDLAALVRLIAGQFKVMVEEKGIRYRLAIAPHLPAQVDPEKIRRVLSNLLSNACKFTPRSGIIRCSLRADGPDAVLEIADSGPGIPPDQRSSVFDRFRQLGGGDTRHFGGTGLGLTIARDFVSLHGGSIDIHDAPEGGALLSVRLPLLAPSGATIRTAPGQPLFIADDVRSERSSPVFQEEPSSARTGEPIDSRPLVLIVEDNREMNRFLRGALAEEFRTLSAYDGEEGLQQALQARPDLILTDVMMPRMSGETMIRAIREHPELDITPIILLTANADDEVKIRLLQHGAQDYLNKPCSVPELRTRTHNLIAAKRSREQLQAARDEADKANRAKSAFLAKASHDFRQPLQAISLLNGALRRMVADPDAADALVQQETTIGVMSRLLNALLDISRLESGAVKPELRNWAVESLFEQVRREFSAVATSKGLRFEVEPSSAAAHSDRALIGQVLRHLVSNAIKYTRNGRVALSCRIEGELACLRVIDTGIGMAPEELARIYDEFYQIGIPAHASREGYGLGLSIVNRIVKLLNARLEVESQLGRGSTFTLWLPIHEPAQAT